MAQKIPDLQELERKATGTPNSGTGHPGLPGNALTAKEVAEQLVGEFE